ncbi:MAG: hypothetical protein ACRDBO_02665 [Lachnospiraceae bacterium]
MKTLVIYDNTGRIYAMYYGEEATPQGIPCIYVDIPEGAQLERIDVTDPENPQPVFAYLPETGIDKLEKQVDALTDEVTTTQLAVVEMYEMMMGGE